MKLVALFFLYPLGGWLVYKLLRFHHSKNPESAADDDGLHIFYAIIWPLTVFGFVSYIFWLATRIDFAAADRRGPSEPMAPWEPKPPAGDYNANNLGNFKEEDPEEMANFIKTLERRPDAPLPDALTFNYKLTGISKTYPAGTMFPSALVNDWRRGYFLGEEKVEETH
jgi:hypothetical protein